MKKIYLFALVLGVVLASVGCGPSYRMQQGALIGAGLGALAGHDIGEDTEGTLIGAAVGGVAGAVIGDAFEQYETNTYGYNYAPYQAQREQYRSSPRRGY